MPPNNLSDLPDHGIRETIPKGMFKRDDGLIAFPPSNKRVIAVVGGFGPDTKQQIESLDVLGD